ncbi:MAG: class I SAM-dependent methyltransferase [Anaerolineae bacterium]|nr:class I SAM-dependent methyltransferase [Anaerolineae bacterium]MDQ7035549.1 class I SAM-dependent methyltransferase [Anaerolineae bacterium]
MPEESINYDRAADFYDATRAYPDGIAEEVAAFIVQKALLKSDTNILEIGIGTGRVAVPLSAHVGSITGIDISSKMLAKIHEKQASAPIQIAEASAENIPFAARTFKHVLVSHILHLVSDPQAVLSEISRVLKRPAQLIHIRGFRDNPPKFEVVADEWRKHRKLGKKSVFERASSNDFFLPSDWFKIEEHRFTYPTKENPKYFLDAIKNRWWSTMWAMSEPELEIAYLAVERVIKEQFGDDYDSEVEFTAGIVLQVFLPKK